MKIYLHRLPIVENPSRFSLSTFSASDWRFAPNHARSPAKVTVKTLLPRSKKCKQRLEFLQLILGGEGWQAWQRRQKFLAANAARNFR